MTITAPEIKVEHTISEFLDPELIVDIQANAKEYDTFQSESDDSKWTIARRTNEDWTEHKGLPGCQQSVRDREIQKWYALP